MNQDTYQAMVLRRKQLDNAIKHKATDSLIVRIVLGAFVGGFVAAIMIAVYSIKNGGF